MKNKIKSFGIIFLVTTIIVIVIFLCLFIIGQKDEVTIKTNHNIRIQTKGNLEIKTVNSDTWENNLSLKQEGTMNWCSGDGNNFYYSDDLVKYQKLHDLNGYTIDTYIDLRSEQVVDVYLGAESSVFSRSKDLTLGNTDFLAACIRIAFFKVTYSAQGEAVIDGEPLFIWAPNSQYEYLEATDAITKNGKSEKNYSYHVSQTITKTYSVEDYFTGKFELSEKMALCVADEQNDEKVAINHAPLICSFSSPNGEGTHLLMRAWFEATDREAILGHNDELVNLNISLIGVSPKNTVHPEESIKSLASLKFVAKSDSTYVLGYDTGNDYDPHMFLWSADGVIWTTLGANKKFTQEDVTNGIYVCLAETENSRVGRTLGLDARLVILEEQENDKK